MTANTTRTQIVDRTGVLPGTSRVARILRDGWRPAMRAGLVAMALLFCCNLAVAANPMISSVAFTGTNNNIQVRIFGADFGPKPPDVPCHRCSTPFLNIADGRGYGCRLFDILSWSDAEIVFSGFQGNPGDSVLISVQNPQTHGTGLRGTTLPRTISLAGPTIKSVSFTGMIGRQTTIIVTGFGFGAAPPGLPASTDLPFFSFLAMPFSAQEWEAGNGGNSVLLNYGSWNDSRIVVTGFGGTYGTKNYKIHPKEPVTIAVANTKTCGLNMNVVDTSLGPTSIAGVWAGHLP